jgi:hypothetical protein
MQSDRPDEGTEEFSVRLAWPKPEPDEPSEEPAAAAAPPPAATAPTIGAELARTPRPTATALELVTAPSEGQRAGQVYVGAFDRLADRLLERLRSLRQDVDADLAAVRAELSSLRQAVDDLGDRVQMRQVKTSVDELRADVAGLRRAMLEWPELEQIGNDVAAVRSDLAFLYETGLGGDEAMQAPSELLGELQAVVERLGERAGDPMLDQPELAALAPLLEEVASVRSDLGAIRRRLQLRSGPLDEEQLEQIVSAVAARVVEELHAGEGRRSRRR